MRSLGIVLIILGALLAYLGFYGKVGEAFNAIKTGTNTAKGNTVISGYGDNIKVG